MPNDIPDWTAQHQAQLQGGASLKFLGDVGAAVVAADSAQESINSGPGVTSAAAVLASFKSSGTPALVKAGAVLEGTVTAVNPLFGQAPGVGNLLVAIVSAYTADPTTATAGWSQAVAPFLGGQGTHLAIWIKPNSAGGDAAPAFTSAGLTVNMQAVLLEFSGVATVAPTDQTGGAGQANGTPSISVATGAADASPGDLVVMGVHWRNGTTAAIATFVESFNNQATAIRAADNGSAVDNDHTVASYAIIPPLVTSLPVGQRPWNYDSTGTSAPGTGNQAKVVLAAIPGKRYIAAHVAASFRTSAAPGGVVAQALQILDGASVIWSVELCCQNIAGDKDHYSESGLAIAGTVGNSMTLQFASGQASTVEICDIGAYLQ